MADKNQLGVTHCPTCHLPLFGTGHINSDGTDCPISPTTDVADSNVTDKKTDKKVGERQLDQAICPDKPTHTIHGCAVCNKNFPTGDELIMHMALHLTNKAKGSLPTSPQTDAVKGDSDQGDDKSLAPELERPSSAEEK